MLPYVAYLRVYEPLIAFGDPDRSRWADYAASAPHTWRADAIEAEHQEALRRLIAVPPIIAPVQESEHAYLRQADGVIYICPWQTRLRTWLALGRLRASLPPALTDALVARQSADVAAADFARWHARSPSARTHILTATWQVPLAWFVPFGAPERWLVLGSGARCADGSASTGAARTLIYVTTMAQARRRVARALGAVRRGLSRGSHPYGGDTPPYGNAARDVAARPPGAPPGAATAPPGAIPRRAGGRHARGPRHEAARHEAARHEAARHEAARHEAARQGDAPDREPAARHSGSSASTDTGASAGGLSKTSLRAAAREIEEVGQWLAEFHPHALVELDYGGLVHRIDDKTLTADQSAAEAAAAITGLETGELELAVAMYQRLRTRWRALRGAEWAS